MTVSNCSVRVLAPGHMQTQGIKKKGQNRLVAEDIKDICRRRDGVEIINPQRPEFSIHPARAERTGEATGRGSEKHTLKIDRFSASGSSVQQFRPSHCFAGCPRL